MRCKETTHVVLRGIAPLLHVHDFHVQHSPKLHLDPAKAMHPSDRQAAAAAAAAAPARLHRNHNIRRGCHLTIQRSIKRAARPRPISLALAFPPR